MGDVEVASWPSGDPGRPLLHVTVGASVDEVFNTLWSTYSDFAVGASGDLHCMRSAG